jgi:organic radical activating enzyme
MLIKITDRCFEGCSHCLANATPQGSKMMSGALFRKSVKFCIHSGAKAILISGGEPTVHPQIKEFLEHVCSKTVVVVLITNGRFYKDKEKMELILRLLRRYKNLSVQISTHEKYYPSHKEFMENGHLFSSWPRTCIVPGGFQIRKLGRAASLEGADFIDSCSCINPILLALQTKSLPYVVRHMENKGYFCGIGVDAGGNVRVGEGVDCLSVGTVAHTAEEVYQELRKSRPCNRCGGLTEKIKAALLVVERLGGIGGENG